MAFQSRGCHTIHLKVKPSDLIIYHRIKQLKRKVMGWGLRKNLKKAEREALVRQQAHVNATGGERVFALDNPLNKVITTARMERMFKRDGIAIEQSADLIPGMVNILSQQTVLTIRVFSYPTRCHIQNCTCRYDDNHRNS